MYPNPNECRLFRTDLIPRRTGQCALAFLSCVVISAHAQDGAEVVEQRNTRQAIWIEPRVTVEATFTNNSRNSGVNPESDLITKVSPGVRALFNTARIKGSVDYALNGSFYAQNTFGNGLQHTLDAKTNINLWDNRVFLDANGVVDRVAISAFGTQAPGAAKNDNLSQSANFLLSPYFRGSLGQEVDIEARYKWQTFSTDTSQRADFNEHELSLRLESPRKAQMLGWAVDAKSQSFDYTLGRTTRRDLVQGSVLYYPTPHLDLAISAGRDANDQITLNRETYTTAGVSLAWRPSERTRLSAGIDRSYFGTGHNVEIEHRTASTIWRFQDRRGVVSNTLEDAVPRRGYNLDMIDPFVERFGDSLLELLDSRGYTSAWQLYRDYLASSATLERTQEASLLWLLGSRGVATLTIGRGSARRLDTLLGPVGDDFDISSSIMQKLWSIEYAYRLTPLTSFNASLGNRKFESSTRADFANSLSSLNIGLTTRLGLRTTGTVQLIRSKYTDSVNPYSAASIVLALTHRF